ncbi:TPA: hypothetical protein ACSBUB_003845, partial [Clostridioides difficile]
KFTLQTIYSDVKIKSKLQLIYKKHGKSLTLVLHLCYNIIYRVNIGGGIKDGSRLYESFNSRTK